MTIAPISNGESMATARAKLNAVIGLTPELVRTGLLAEYRFDEGSGASLVDYSGNSRDAAIVTEGTAPTWTKQGINFNGERQSANHSHAALPSGFIGSARTVMCVCRMPSAPAQYDSIVGHLQNGAVGKPLMVGQTGDAIMSLVTYTNGSSTSSESVGVDEWVCHTWTGPSSGNDRFFKNEREVISYQAQVNSNAYPFQDPAFIGKWQLTTNTNNFGSKMTYAYWVAYDRVLTDDEIAYNYGVMKRVCEARGIGFKAPRELNTYADHLLIVGDSITAGSGSSTTNNKYAQIFANAATALSIGNTQLGVSGKKVTGMREAMLWAFSKNYARGKKLCSVFAGTNDIAAVITPVATFQALVDFYSYCYKNGIDLIVSTMMSRGATTGYDAQKNELNGYIRAYFPRPGAYLVDPASNPGLGSDYQSIDFTGNTTNGSAVVTNIASTSGWYPGMYVNGTNVPAAGAVTGLGGTAILSVDSATQITLNANATVTQTGATLNIKTGASNLFYQNTDNTHPKDVGHALIAGYFIAALQACLNLNAQPKIISAATYTGAAADLEIHMNPASNSQTLTMMPATGITGAIRIVRNIQKTGSNTVTVLPAPPSYAAPITETLSEASSIVLANGEAAVFKSVMRPTNPRGCYWERLS